LEFDVHRFFVSLHIRQVDAGSCNACELEISGLTGPHYDLERFGLHFVASPRQEPARDGGRWSAWWRARAAWTPTRAATRPSRRTMASA
jgi:hypothetical protein